MTEYTILIKDRYVAPSGPLTEEQYVNFVMNRAAESYKQQYGAATTNEGVSAACKAYNATLAIEVAPIKEEGK